MATNRYIGARYVPIFAGAWDNTQEYEPLTIVSYQGDSYTSRGYVPTGIAINNTQYWAKTGDFNQQVASLQNSLQLTDGRVQDIEGAVHDIEGDIEDISEYIESPYARQHFVKEYTDVGAGQTISYAITPGQDISTIGIDISKEGYTPISICNWVTDFHINGTGVDYENNRWRPSITNMSDETKSGVVTIVILYVKNFA